MATVTTGFGMKRFSRSARIEADVFHRLANRVDLTGERETRNRRQGGRALLVVRSVSFQTETP